MSIFDYFVRKLNEESSRSRRNEIEVDLAICWARAGYIDTAKSMLEKSKKSVDFSDDAKSSVMLMLLSGLIEFYSKRDIGFAIDKLNRAAKLSVMIGSDALTSRLNAWLAHMYFNDCNYDQMLLCIGVAVECLDASNHDSRTRVCLTVGDALCCAGRFDLAALWYSSARREAEKIGDQMAIAAIMHNRSGMALAHCRFGSAFGHSTPEPVKRLLREVSSAEQYEKYSRFETVLLPYSIWAGRVALFEGRMEAAVDLLEVGLGRNISAVWSAMEQAVRVDLGYAKMMAGVARRGEFELSRVDRGGIDRLYSDDRAVACKMLADIAGFTGCFDDEADFRARAEKSRLEFFVEMGEIEEVALRIHDAWSLKVGIGS